MRRHLAAGLAAALVASPGLLATGTAHADHTDLPDRVTLMGSLMDELDCAEDWDVTCAVTDLAATGTPGVYALEAALPAGEYAFKVRLDGDWAENYGAGGVANGPDIPLALVAPATLRFTYDHATHRTSVVPVAAQPAGPTPADRALASDSLREDLTRERFYFVMADRFANGRTDNDTGGTDPAAGPLVHGFDPTHKGFFHGGDLAGMLERLDYIEGLGTTAIWLTPSFANKPVQGTPGNETAGYHGYWVTDFTRIDPHLGTNEELKALVDAAHDRGIKVFFDIITNHTADVLGYDDAVYDERGQAPYRSKAEHPYRDAAGVAFDDRDFASGEEFPELDPETSFPYAPRFLAPGDETAKTPAWLNDPTMYHNRGTSTFAGEDAEYGDFPSGDRSALDDLFTERPEVVEGMVDIYRTWVREVGIDGFRIDTVKHVNIEFWQQFAPALQGYAAELGNDDFFMFGEVYDTDPRFVSRYTTEGRLQAAVDFGFQGSATGFAKGRPTGELRDFFASDDWFTDADSNVYSLPTFLGNHDMGRVGHFLATGDGATTGDELLRRSQLAHSLMYLTRGQPVVYYGDEQGFVGDGGDQDAREDMFASQVASYNDNDLIGTDATTAGENFDADHPLYRHIAALAELREEHPALADGAQVHRFASDRAGVYAFSRIDADEQVEYLVAVNNATTPQTVELDTFSAGQRFRPVWPARGPQLRSGDDGRVSVTVPALSVTVHRAARALSADTRSPEPRFTGQVADGTVGGRAEVSVQLSGRDFTQVTFAARPVGTTDWQVLGTDDNAPYRVFHDVRGLAPGTLVEYRAVARDHDGDLGVATGVAAVGEPAAAPAPGGGGSGPVVQPSRVTVPGSLNSEMGCPGDWQPGCAQAELALDPTDGIWKGTFELPAGSYEYKVALEGSWEENYGAGATRNGSNIPLTVGATGPVTFFYDRRTNHVSSTAQGAPLVAVGDFQSELGCPEDGSTTCLAGWLQDPDGDGTAVLRTDRIPAGTWSLAAHARGDAAPRGATSFTVPADGLVTTVAFDTAADRFTVTTAEPAPVPDLAARRAAWVQRDLVALALPAGDRRGWTYRLHSGAPGTLALDAETVGGSSLPLTVDPAGLPAAVVAADPALAGRDALRLSRRDARGAEALRRGQLAVAVYDASGRLVDATGVEVRRWQGRG